MGPAGVILDCSIIAKILSCLALLTAFLQEEAHPTAWTKNLCPSREFFKQRKITLNMSTEGDVFPGSHIGAFRRDISDLTVRLHYFSFPRERIRSGND